MEVSRAEARVVYVVSCADSSDLIWDADVSSMALIRSKCFARFGKVVMAAAEAAALASAEEEEGSWSAKPTDFDSLPFVLEVRDERDGLGGRSVDSAMPPAAAICEPISQPFSS